MSEKKQKKSQYTVFTVTEIKCRTDTYFEVNPTLNTNKIVRRMLIEKLMLSSPDVARIFIKAGCFVYVIGVRFKRDSILR